MAGGDSGGDGDVGGSRDAVARGGGGLGRGGSLAVRHCSEVLELCECWYVLLQFVVGPNALQSVKYCSSRVALEYYIAVAEYYCSSRALLHSRPA